MITEVNLENFKSFSNTTIKFAPLTVLTGMNATGKSSVIQAIRMIKKHYESPNGDFDLLEHSNPSLLKSKLTKDNAINLSFILNSQKFYINSIVESIGTYSFDCPVTSSDDIENLNSIIYLSADRYGPKNELPILHQKNDNIIGNYGEYIISYIESNKYNDVPEQLRLNKNSTSLISNINDWLSIISPNTKLEYEYVTTSEVVAPKYNSIVPTETGFGLSFTLPVITMLLSTKVKILLVENPEAHLHPAAQTMLGKLVALASANGKQVIIETHSDHIIDGIRIATKKQDIKAKDVNFHFFKRDSFDKSTEIQTPELSEDGKLSFWPEGFFDQGLIDKAILARKN